HDLDQRYRSEQEKRNHISIQDTREEDRECLAIIAAQRDQELIGQALLRWVPKRAMQLQTGCLRIHLENVYVVPEFRNHHVGASLIWEALKRATKAVSDALLANHKINDAVVFVAKDRLGKDATAWFAKLGFEEN